MFNRWLTVLRNLVGIAALCFAVAPAHAQVFKDDLSNCTPGGAATGDYGNAGGSIRVTIYRAPPATCPQWTFTGPGVVYLARVTEGSAPAPGTQAIWLNEENSSATRTVSGLTPGNTYTLSVDAWTDDVFAATALGVDFGGSTATLQLPARSGQQTLKVSLCARTKDVEMVLSEAGATASSPVFTNVRVVDDRSPCAGMFTLGGTLSGLTAGQSIVLLSSAGNPITLTNNGAFTFPGALADTSGYVITVGTQSTGQQCTVTNGSGTIAGSNITNVLVSCTAAASGISAVPVDSLWMLVLASLALIGVALTQRKRSR